ncbi:MAG: hypothetical protein NZ837_03805 [Gammaproteobacteria bacterium]|nr:hypothetical protein [Gammaproteobacteria bacterium]
MGLNKMFRSKIFIHLLILSASTCLYGQEDENADPDQGPQENVSQRPIEEIQVIGERSLSFLRNEIRREEENLYRIFNELNSHDRFDIKCKVERRTWSYILARNCYPKFFTDLRMAENRFALSELRQAFGPDGVDSALFDMGMAKMKNDRQIRELAAGDYQALSEEMLRIASENPDYLNILMKVADLKANYQAAHEERFGSDN